MSLKRLINANQKELDSIISKFDKRLQGVFKKINALSTARVAGLTNIDEVVAFDVVWRGILQESGYYNLMQRYVNSLDDLQGSISAILDEAGLLKELGKDQLQRLSAIKELQIKGIEQIGIDAGLALKQGLYNNLLAGKTKGDLVEALSTQLSGTKYESYAKTYANTSINDYRQATMNQRAEAFAEDEDIVWIYDGNDVDDVTRPFCEDILIENRAYSNEEKQELESAPERQWNCRHFFVFITKKEAIELGYTVDGELPKEEEKPVEEKAKFKTVKDGEKAFNTRLKENAKDSRYIKDSNGIPVTRFRKKGRKYANKGEELQAPTKLTGLNINSVNELDKVVDELDTLAKSYRVPKIRNMTPNAGKSIATMGDGQLSVSPKYINMWTNPKSIKELGDEVGELRTITKNQRNEIDRLMASYKKDRASINIVQYNKLVDTYNKNLKNPKLWEYKTRARLNELSTWKIGDAPKDRPHNAFNYFKKETDKIKNTLIHEFGHHIHQQFGVVDAITLEKPPLEKALRILFTKAKTVSPTAYADTNYAEWFAESFSLYSMGQKKLVDKVLIDLLDKMKSGKIFDEASLNTWLNGVV